MEITNRKNTNSLKWDDESVDLPLWVADMDFASPKEVIETLKERVNIKAYGYSIIPDEYFLSILNYYEKYHHIKFKKEEMIYTSGVVAAISSMVRSLTKVNDNIVVLSPVYNIFYNSILNNKRNVLASNLIYENQSYKIDWQDLEEKLAKENASMLIFCNPHNPTGNIWSKEEIIKIGELCNKYHVLVISDEIHCDICDPGFEYNSFGINDVNKNISITCISPSKVFNLAGLQSACVIIPNSDIRKKADRGFNNDEIAEPNFFSIASNITAYNKCRYYVEELNKYIKANKDYFYNFVEKEIPNIKIVKSHSLYLVWLDISKLNIDSVTFVNKLKKEESLRVSDGLEYGENARYFIRINLATSLDNIKEASKRLKRFIDKLCY